MANRRAGNNGEATRYQSGEEAAKAGKKGGIASGAVRRQHASFRDAFKVLMTDEDRRLIYLALMDKAKAGDVRAAEFLRDTMGEKPTERFEQTVSEITFRIEGVSAEEADLISG